MAEIKTNPKTPTEKERLFSDLDLQDIIVLNLERAVQVCVDIAAHIIAEFDVRTPMSMADSFTRLHEAGVITNSTGEKLRKSVGFRNIAIHEYQSINWDVVYSVITDHLDDFRLYAREVLEWLEERNQE
ncbi:MAG: DUF86 domain-containing protein [Thermodesulfobacteriota bacterium]|nr:DUF86 domain-containing protein [Thermodesulfobacteriota bacterium]